MPTSCRARSSSRPTGRPWSPRRRPGATRASRLRTGGGSRVRSTCRPPTPSGRTANWSIDRRRSTVRYDTAVERLANLPEVLPPPAAALMPVIVGDPEGVPPRIPPPGGAGRPAGVLVLLHPGDDGETRVVLTERVTRDGH